MILFGVIGLKREIIRQKIYDSGVKLRKGQWIKLLTGTQNPYYDKGEMLKVVDPWHGEMLGRRLVLATGDNGKVALTLDQFQIGD